MAKKTVKITLVKSLIGSSKTQLATAAALGLKRPGDVAEQPDNAQTGGQVFKLSHLVRVEK